MHRKALIVVGPHRSSAFTLTRALNLAGAFFLQKLMSPVIDNNEHGFWELASGRLRWQGRREELKRSANRLDESVKFLQLMAQAVIERARLGGEATA